MKVQVNIPDTHYALRTMYTAARTCYSKDSPIDIFYHSASIPQEEMLRLIDKVINAGHLSTIEHFTFTLLIEGVSRALTHQLVRHRLASYSQQSQRYCRLDDGFAYLTPDSISTNEELNDGFKRAMATLSDLYDVLIEEGIPSEDARAILPNACLSNIVVTCNFRQLMHICNERLCKCAQLEIRRLFQEITKQFINQCPWAKKYLVPKCEVLGYCNEFSTRSCGRKPLKQNVLKIK